MSMNWDNWTRVNSFVLRNNPPLFDLFAEEQPLFDFLIIFLLLLNIMNIARSNFEERSPDQKQEQNEKNIVECEWVLINNITELSTLLIATEQLTDFFAVFYEGKWNHHSFFLRLTWIDFHYITRYIKNDKNKIWRRSKWHKSEKYRNKQRQKLILCVGGKIS